MLTNTESNITLRKTEDLRILGEVEKLLLSRRGYIVKMPSPGTPVIASLSGGMDSVINTAILLEEFELKMFPIFINRGQSNYKYEKRAVVFFEKFFKKRYGNLYNEYLEVSINSPAAEYKAMLRQVKQLQDNPRLRNTVAYPARNPIIALSAAEYAYSLQARGIFPKTIFLSFNADDPPLHSTLTALRELNLLLCHIMGDYNWQLISIPLEREFGNYYGKARYIQWASEHNIPLQYTRSCYSNLSLHCGECIACRHRRAAFNKAKVADPTNYQR